MKRGSAEGGRPAGEAKNPEWRVIVDFLRRADQALLARLARKMVNHLCWSGVAQAQELLRRFGPPAGALGGFMKDNRPLAKSQAEGLERFAQAAFR
ncbi:MAG: hypothetical protein PHF00_05540, partial [Elusimicrobia bacterium]|nr:hypothetical protein [Elusimicrobiota bacterium]